MSKKERKKYTIFIIAILAVTAGIYLYANTNKPKNSMDFFASCIKESGAKVYGTQTCTYCKKQKEDFGESSIFLPFIDCSSPSGGGTNYICKNNDIKSYPTWVFNDNTRKVGKQPLEVLAEKTGCELPN